MTCTIDSWMILVVSFAFLIAVVLIGFLVFCEKNPILCDKNDVYGEYYD